MKKTEVAREVADSLHAAEESLELTLTQARAALARMTAAKVELGLTGTLGDRSIARAAACVAALEEARQEIMEGHQEAYRILKLLDIRGVASMPTFMEARAGEEIRAA